MCYFYNLQNFPGLFISTSFQSSKRNINTIFFIKTIDFLLGVCVGG